MRYYLHWENCPSEGSIFFSDKTNSHWLGRRQSCNCIWVTVISEILSIFEEWTVIAKVITSSKISDWHGQTKSNQTLEITFKFVRPCLDPFSMVIWY